VILDRVRAAGPGEAILISNFLRDSAERHYPRDAAMSRIATEAGAPVFTTVLSSLGQGVAVGLGNRGYQHGAWAGHRVLQLLRDPTASVAAVEKEPTGRVVADVRALNRWGIDPRRLPADAILINEPASFYRANKSVVWIAASVALAQTLAVVALLVNVRRRRRAEGTLRSRTEHLEQTLAALEQARVERLEIEERLRQGERLESMGRLAGGIAHDFNNLLTVILSYAEVASAEAPPSSELAGHMEQIQLAGNSAADLTRQILAFSRRQVLLPEMVDLNQLVEQSTTLIRRLLTRAIEISLRLQSGLPPIRIDQTQVQQVLINLAVNARDAMPKGGTLQIDTAAVDADPAFAAAHPPMKPGRHVVLSVTDTGTGMSREVLDRIFDPFFTTKPQGRGTGLGLASVYGTVTQSGGWIWASSEPGLGTTFTIHFPVPEQ
jgi:signal transduction histidine kinase